MLLEKLWRPSPWLLFYIGPPSPPTLRYPPPGPLGPPWELPQTIFIPHLRRSNALHNFTVLLELDLEKRFEICKVLALGGPPPGPPWWPHIPYEHLWIPGPWGWFLPSLVKIQPCISSRSRWTVTFYIGPPPKPVTPHGGHWGHPGNCHQQPLFFT